jgi:pseudaminic acid biosynthesis-associated methylase
MENKQNKFWKGDFGVEYTERCCLSIEEWDKYYLNNFGIKRSEINVEFIGSIHKDSKILEVGSNVGLELTGIQRMGFHNLFGIDIQPFAVEKSKEVTKNINIICASGFDIPFKDDYFDIVYTTGVLIHIAPENIDKIMDEIYRCSKKYIWGFEYFAESYTSINYRGNEDFLWKANFADLYLKRFKDLKLTKKKIFHYINSDSGNKDCMFLLEKIN